MTSWLIKAAVHQALTYLPAPHALNNALKRTSLTEYKFMDALMRTRNHMAAYEAAKSSAMPARVVEIGTGWYPTSPLAFWLCGADQVLTVDIDRHLTERRLSATLSRFSQFQRAGRLETLLPRVNLDRAQQLIRLADSSNDLLRRLEHMGLGYRVCDIAENGLDAGTADFLYSSGVLQHLPYEVLVGLLRATARVLSPAACSSHWVDLRDQYSYIDSRITPYNYLRYSERAWRRVNSPLTPQSRLRIADYRRAFAESGLMVTDERLQRGKVAVLDRVPLAAEFLHHSRDDLLVLDALLVASPRRQ